MPSDFAVLWTSVQPIVDAQWGEPACIVPQQTDELSEYVEIGIDARRPLAEVIGIFSLDPVVDRFLGRGANSRDNTDIMDIKSTVDFAETNFPPGAEPKDGDIVIALSRPRIPAFKIVASDYDGTARWVCKLVFDRFEQ